MSSQLRLDYQKTMDAVCLHIRAGAPVILLQTHEEDRALDNIARIWRVLRNEHPQKNLLTWHAGTGLRHLAGPGVPRPQSWLAVPGRSGLTEGTVRNDN